MEIQILGKIKPCTKETNLYKTYYTREIPNFRE